MERRAVLGAAALAAVLAAVGMLPYAYDRLDIGCQTTLRFAGGAVALTEDQRMALRASLRRAEQSRTDVLLYVPPTGPDRAIEQVRLDAALAFLSGVGNSRVTISSLSAVGVPAAADGPAPGSDVVVDACRRTVTPGVG